MSALLQSGLAVTTGARGKGWRTKRARRRALLRARVHALHSGRPVVPVATQPDVGAPKAASVRRLVTERTALLAAVAVGGLGLQRHDELAFWIYVVTICPAAGWVHGARWQRRWPR